MLDALITQVPADEEPLWKYYYRCMPLVLSMEKSPFYFLIPTPGTIGGLFSQILSGEEIAREKAIQFLSNSVADYGKKVLHNSPETEGYLVEEVKKVGLVYMFLPNKPAATNKATSKKAGNQNFELLGGCLCDTGTSFIPVRNLISYRVYMGVILPE